MFERHDDFQERTDHYIVMPFHLWYSLKSCFLNQDGQHRAIEQLQRHRNVPMDLLKVILAIFLLSGIHEGLREHQLHEFLNDKELLFNHCSFVKFRREN